MSSPLTVNVTGAGTGITILSPADLGFLNSSPVIVTGNGCGSWRLGHSKRHPR